MEIYLKLRELARGIDPHTFVKAAEEAAWGEGYHDFFSDAYDALERGEVTEIPEKWKKSPEGERYESYIEIL